MKINVKINKNLPNSDFIFFDLFWSSSVLKVMGNVKIEFMLYGLFIDRY